MIKHLDLTIKRNGGTGNSVSSTLNVLRDDFTLAGNKYYISPASELDIRHLQHYIIQMDIHWIQQLQEENSNRNCCKCQF